MATSKKALEIANYLRADLAVRMAGLSTAVAVGAVSFDTDSNPLIQIGTGGIGAQGGLVKVMPLTWSLAKDALGLSQDVFTPHVIQVAFEANPTGGAGADVNSLETLSAILFTLGFRGCRVEVYQSANGVAPVVGTLVVGNLKHTFEPDLWYGIKSGQ